MIIFGYVQLNTIHETSLVRFCFLFFTWLSETFKQYVACILSLLDCVCAQSCPTLGDPMDCSPPGSSVHGIFQARTLAWIAVFFSRGSSWPRDWTESLASQALAGGFLPWSRLGSPLLDHPTLKRLLHPVLMLQQTPGLSSYWKQL